MHHRSTAPQALVTESCYVLPLAPIGMYFVLQQPSHLQPFLDRLTSRSVLSEPEQREVLALPIRIRQVQPHEDFVRLGENVTHASLVVEGLVGRFDQNWHGDRQITALHIEGEMPDLHSV